MLDWQTIWRSELQALAMDREASEALEAAVLASVIGLAAQDNRPAAPAAGPDAPAWATAAAAPPDARDAILRLERRVAELERLAHPAADGG